MFFFKIWLSERTASTRVAPNAAASVGTSGFGFHLLIAGVFGEPEPESAGRGQGGIRSQRSWKGPTGGARHGLRTWSWRTDRSTWPPHPGSWADGQTTRSNPHNKVGQQGPSHKEGQQSPSHNTKGEQDPSNYTEGQQDPTLKEVQQGPSHSHAV